MVNQFDKKYTWVIKNFSSLQYEQIYSDLFVIGGCKWCLLAYPKGRNKANNLSLFLEVVDAVILPCGWRRHTQFSITVVNQLSEKLSQVKEERLWCFYHKFPIMGFYAILPFTKLHAKDSGFLVNDELKIVVEIEVLEVVGKLDVPNESETSIPLFFPLPTTQPQKKRKLEETIDVNGFRLLPSQVEFVRRFFETYPDIALQLRAKNQPLRSSCLYVLLGLFETLCKSLDEISNDNMAEADNSLNYLKKSGLEIDWLEKKVEEVKEKNKEEQICAARTQEVEETLNIFKQKCSQVEALLEKENAKLLEKKLEEVKEKNEEEHIDETRMQELEEELKGVKQNCSVVETLLVEKKEELKGLRQKCSDIEAKVLAARAPALTLDDVV